MLKSFRAASLAVVVAGLSGPAIGQQSSTEPATAPAQGKASSGYMNEVICQKQEIIGTRLGSKRVCKTRAEWADARLRDRQEVERVQTQRGIPQQ